MIKVNKDRLFIEGEITVVMAEYMSITACMLEDFGVECVLNMINGALEEMGITDE